MSMASLVMQPTCLQTNALSVDTIRRIPSKDDVYVQMFGVAQNATTFYPVDQSFHIRISGGPPNGGVLTRIFAVYQFTPLNQFLSICSTKYASPGSATFQFLQNATRQFPGLLTADGDQCMAITSALRASGATTHNSLMAVLQSCYNKTIRGKRQSNFSVSNGSISSVVPSVINSALSGVESFRRNFG